MTQTNRTMELSLPIGKGSEPRMYRSRYGGLWIDRRDAHDILEARRARGEVSNADAEDLAFYIDNGYVVFEKATDESVIDEYLDLYETAWDVAPDPLYLHREQKVVPLERRYYDDVTKMSGLHSFFAQSGELIFPPRVLRFLTQIFDRDPVALQSMTMRKGPRKICTSTRARSRSPSRWPWPDPGSPSKTSEPHSGEFQFIPGSHRLPELLHYGTNKGYQGDIPEFRRISTTKLRMCNERGLKTEKFWQRRVTC